MGMWFGGRGKNLSYDTVLFNAHSPDSVALFMMNYVFFLFWHVNCVYMCGCMWKHRVDISCLPLLFSTSILRQARLKLTYLASLASQHWDWGRFYVNSKDPNLGPHACIYFTHGATLLSSSLIFSLVPSSMRYLEIVNFGKWGLYEKCNVKWGFRSVVGNLSRQNAVCGCLRERSDGKGGEWPAGGQALRATPQWSARLSFRLTYER